MVVNSLALLLEEQTCANIPHLQSHCSSLSSIAILISRVRLRWVKKETKLFHPFCNQYFLFGPPSHDSWSNGSRTVNNRISTRRMELHEDPESKGWVIATAMPDPVFLEHPLSSWKTALAVALSGDNDLSSWIWESKWHVLNLNGAQIVCSCCQGWTWRRVVLSFSVCERQK